MSFFFFNFQRRRIGSGLALLQCSLVARRKSAATYCASPTELQYRERVRHAVPVRGRRLVLGSSGVVEWRAIAQAAQGLAGRRLASVHVRRTASVREGRSLVGNRDSVTPRAASSCWWYHVSISLLGSALRRRRVCVSLMLCRAGPGRTLPDAGLFRQPADVVMPA